MFIQMDTIFVEVTTAQHAVVMPPENDFASTTCLQQVIDSVDCSVVLLQAKASEVGRTLPSYHLADNDFWYAKGIDQEL